MPGWLKIPLLVLLLATASTFIQGAVPAAVSKEALAVIKTAIADVQADIGKRNSERQSAYQSLQESEQALGDINRLVTQTEGAIRDNQSRLSTLATEQSRLQQLQLRQRQLIGQYLRSAWQSGRQEYLKLLLNQEDPAQLSRTLQYYRYFSAARSDRISEYTTTLENLAAVGADIQATTLNLETQQRALADQRASLEQRTSERQALLDDLDTQLAASNLRLLDLRAEQDEMEILIEELRRSIANLALGDQQQPFSGMQGKLPWPVEGRLQNRWGTPFGNGDLSWQGVTLATVEGADVHAIHHGRVVFADWFSSSGLLLIIDHGDGYMSLYAHNQALYRDVGEWVDSGETIAAVGNTGGQQEFGLYFEIRHNGESLNPSGWCLARN